MPVISRTYVFSPGTTIVSSQVNSELDGLYRLFSGLELTKDVYIGGSNISNNLAPPKLYVKGQAEFSSAANGRVIGVYKDGETSPRISIDNTGQIKTKAGQSVTPSEDYMYLGGGYIGSGNNSVGNIGAGETDLLGFTIGDNVFLGSGTVKYIKIKAAGVTAANDNDKRFQFYVKTVSLFDTGIINPNNQSWHCDFVILYNGFQLIVDYRFVCDNTEMRGVSVFLDYDPSIDNDFKWTGTGEVDDDIIQYYFVGEKDTTLN